MKKYIQPSVVVKEIELAPMMTASDPDNLGGPDGSRMGGGTTDYSNSHRGWNLWGVED